MTAFSEPVRKLLRTDSKSIVSRKRITNNRNFHFTPIKDISICFQDFAANRRDICVEKYTKSC